MFERTKLSTAALVALGGVMLAMPAYAQQTGERIEITGSRIKSIEVEGISPITVVDAKEIKTEGLRNVESFLNNLPQVFLIRTAPWPTDPPVLPRSICVVWATTARWCS